MITIAALAAERGLSYGQAYRLALRGEFGRLVRLDGRWLVEPLIGPAPDSSGSGPLRGLLEATRNVATLLENVVAFRGVPGSELTDDEAAAVEDLPDHIADALDGLTLQLAQFHVARRAVRSAAGRQN